MRVGTADLPDSRRSALLTAFRRETFLISRFDHPNVLLFIGASMSKEIHILVTEFCGKGDLYDILRDLTVK